MYTGGRCRYIRLSADVFVGSEVGVVKIEIIVSRFYGADLLSLLAVVPGRGVRYCEGDSVWSL